MKSMKELKEELIKSERFEIRKYDDAEMESFLCHRKKNAVLFTKEGIELINYDDGTHEGTVMAEFGEGYIPALKIIDEYFGGKK